MYFTKAYRFTLTLELHESVLIVWRGWLGARKDISPIKVIYWLQRSSRVLRIFLGRADWYPKRVRFVFICNSSIQVRMKKALRETQTLRALAVVRFGHRPPARAPARCKQTTHNTHRQDRLQYTAPLASAQCNNNRNSLACYDNLTDIWRCSKVVSSCAASSADFWLNDTVYC